MSPPLQLPLLPPGLQQMQQLLQSSPLAGLNPAQLQQLVQQGQQNRDNFADSGRKQLEQLIPQLQAGRQQYLVHLSGHWTLWAHLRLPCRASQSWWSPPIKLIYPWQCLLI